jgi:hypothetical protein
MIPVFCDENDILMWEIDARNARDLCEMWEMCHSISSKIEEGVQKKVGQMPMHESITRVSPNRTIAQCSRKVVPESSCEVLYLRFIVNLKSEGKSTYLY